MEIWQLTAIGLCCALIGLVLRQHRPEFAPLVGLLCTAAVLFFIAPKLLEIFRLLEEFAAAAGLSAAYLAPLFRIIGVAYIVQFGAGLCRDAGENAIAANLELAGKILIAVMAVPIIRGMFEIVMSIL